MKISFLTLIAFIVFLSSSTAFDAETERTIDDFVEDVFMQNNHIPGVGLSIVRNGTVLMSKGYGMRNISAGHATDGNTLFAIGSISKSFVAVLVVKTLSELYPNLDSAVLDIPLAQLIPSTFNFTLSDRYRAEQTTFRDILSHRVCLLNTGHTLIFGSLPSSSEYAYRARYLPEVCSFRNGFEYNNNLLSLAGDAIAAIAGSTLQSMVISLVRDIGMANTTYIDFDGNYESLPDMSQPYILKNGTLVEFDIFQVRKVHKGLGAGGMLSSANDMTKYMDFHLNQGRVGDRQIVPSNVMRWLYTVSMPFDFEGGRTDDEDSLIYGDLGTAQGLFSGLYDGWSVIHHGGYWPPYHCDMRLFPATRIGVFMCANGPGAILEWPSHEVVALHIFEWTRQSNQSVEHLSLKNFKVFEPFIEHQLFIGSETNRVPTALHHSQIRNHVELSDVIGVYGQPYDGNLIIRYAPNSGNATLQVYFSEWAFGQLRQVDGSNTTFTVEWETTIMDHFYSYPWEVPNFWIDFGIVDTVLIRGGELDSYDELEFVKNATLDTFPVIPWTPTSCGPE